MSQHHILKEGKYLRLLEHRGWEYVERVTGSDVVVVVPITPDGQLVLTEQYRTAVDSQVVDLPAGLAGDIAGAEDEPLVEAARRELLEETGYESSELNLLAEGPSSPGMSTEMLTFFLAADAKCVGPGGGDASEKIEVHLVPLANVDDWLLKRRQAGSLVDAKIYAGLYFASRVGRAER